MAYKDREKQRAWERLRSKVRRKALQQRYRENKEHHLDIVKERLEERKQYVRELKAKSHCEKCGESHPACLDFHHLDPDNKEADIVYATRSFGMRRLKAEIAKCAILCSNCHRKLHWEEVK